jgi:hypothetical protein
MRDPAGALLGDLERAGEAIGRAADFVGNWSSMSETERSYYIGYGIGNATGNALIGAATAGVGGTLASGTGRLLGAIGRGASNVAVDALQLGSGLGPDVRLMKILRELPPGGAQNIVNEMKALTFGTGLEHGVLRLRDGRRVLVSGGADGISFSPTEVKRVLIHTHPFGRNTAGPSCSDLDSLSRLGQRRSFVIDRGLVVPFGNY